MFPLYVPSDKSDNIFGLFRYIYVFARLWGYVSFSVNLNNVPLPCKVKVSLINGFLLLIQLTVHVICFVVIFNEDMQHATPHIDLAIYGIHKVLEFGILCGFLFLLADVINRQKIWRIFQKFMHFDREVRQPPNSSEAVIYKNFNFVLIVIISIYNILLYLKYYDLHFVIFAFLVVLLVSGVYVNILSIHSFVLHNVKIRFEVLNKSIRRLFAANRKVPTVKVIEDDFVEDTGDTLIMMAKLHGQLNDIVDDLNSCYSIQVMICFASIFSHLVFGIFSLYRIWFSIENIFEDEEFLLTSVDVLWAIFYLWLGLCTIFLASSTIAEAQYTGVVIHECINATHNHILVERLLAFSIQMLHRKPDANCKLFSFDWKLLHSILAAMTTYLMILIQFDTSNKKSLTLAENHCTSPQIRNVTTS